MHMHDGHADSPPPSSLFISPSSSSLDVACQTGGYELHCLLSGLVQGRVWAWLTEILEPIAVEAVSALGAAGWRNTLQFTASQLCRPKVFSVSSSLSNQPLALTHLNVMTNPQPACVVSVSLGASIQKQQVAFIDYMSFFKGLILWNESCIRRVWGAVAARTK